MYEYEFEEVMFGTFGKAKAAHRELIRERAAQGWRLAHFALIPSNTSGTGEALELIFERPYRGPQDATRADGPDELGTGAPVYQAPPQLSPVPPAEPR